jgi:hypothetical protein
MDIFERGELRAAISAKPGSIGIFRTTFRAFDGHD